MSGANLHPAAYFRKAAECIPTYSFSACSLAFCQVVPQVCQLLLSWFLHSNAPWTDLTMLAPANVQKLHPNAIQKRATKATHAVDRTKIKRLDTTHPHQGRFVHQYAGPLLHTNTAFRTQRHNVLQYTATPPVYPCTGFMGTTPSSWGMISRIFGSSVQLLSSATVLSNKGVMRVHPASISQ